MRDSKIVPKCVSSQLAPTNFIFNDHKARFVRHIYAPHVKGGVPIRKRVKEEHYHVGIVEFRLQEGASVKLLHLLLSVEVDRPQHALNHRELIELETPFSEEMVPQGHDQHFAL